MVNILDAHDQHLDLHAIPGITSAHIDDWVTTRVHQPIEDSIGRKRGGAADEPLKYVALSRAQRLGTLGLIAHAFDGHGKTTVIAPGQAAVGELIDEIEAVAHNPARTFDALLDFLRDHPIQVDGKGAHTINVTLDKTLAHKIATAVYHTSHTTGGGVRNRKDAAQKAIAKILREEVTALGVSSLNRQTDSLQQIINVTEQEAQRGVTMLKPDIDWVTIDKDGAKLKNHSKGERLVRYFGDMPDGESLTLATHDGLVHGAPGDANAVFTQDGRNQLLQKLLSAVANGAAPAPGVGLDAQVDGTALSAIAGRQLDAAHRLGLTAAEIAVNANAAGNGLGAFDTPVGGAANGDAAAKLETMNKAAILIAAAYAGAIDNPTDINVANYVLNTLGCNVAAGAGGAGGHVNGTNAVKTAIVGLALLSHKKALKGEQLTEDDVTKTLVLIDQGCIHGDNGAGIIQNGAVGAPPERATIIDHVINTAIGQGWNGPLATGIAANVGSYLNGGIAGNNANHYNNCLNQIYFRCRFAAHGAGGGFNNGPAAFASDPSSEIAKNAIARHFSEATMEATTGLEKGMRALTMRAYKDSLDQVQLTADQAVTDPLKQDLEKIARGIADYLGRPGDAEAIARVKEKISNHYQSQTIPITDVAGFIYDIVPGNPKTFLNKVVTSDFGGRNKVYREQEFTDLLAKVHDYVYATDPEQYPQTDKAAKQLGIQANLSHHIVTKGAHTLANRSALLTATVQGIATTASGVATGFSHIKTTTESILRSVGSKVDEANRNRIIQKITQDLIYSSGRTIPVSGEIERMIPVTAIHVPSGTDPEQARRDIADTIVKELTELKELFHNPRNNNAANPNVAELVALSAGTVTTNEVIRAALGEPIAKFRKEVSRDSSEALMIAFVAEHSLMKVLDYYHVNRGDDQTVTNETYKEIMGFLAQPGALDRPEEFEQMLKGASGRVGRRRRGKTAQYDTLGNGVIEDIMKQYLDLAAFVKGTGPVPEGPTGNLVSTSAYDVGENNLRKAFKEKFKGATPDFKGTIPASNKIGFYDTKTKQFTLDPNNFIIHEKAFQDFAVRQTKLLDSGQKSLDKRLKRTVESMEGQSVFQKLEALEKAGELYKRLKKFGIDELNKPELTKAQRKTGREIENLQEKVEVAQETLDKERASEENTKRSKYAMFKDTFFGSWWRTTLTVLTVVAIISAILFPPLILAGLIGPGAAGGGAGLAAAKGVETGLAIAMYFTTAAGALAATVGGVQVNKTITAMHERQETKHGRIHAAEQEVEKGLERVDDLQLKLDTLNEALEFEQTAQDTYKSMKTVDERIAAIGQERAGLETIINAGKKSLSERVIDRISAREGVGKKPREMTFAEKVDLERRLGSDVERQV